MKKHYLTISFCLLIFGLQAQFQWAVKGGRWAYDYGYGITTDVNGNIYVSGKYEEDANFTSVSAPTTSVTCAGNHDAFLIKYDPSGNIIWIRTAGGVLGDYAEAISSDGTNYVYMSGEIEGTNETISFSGSTITLQAVNDNDIFFAKYDFDGNLIWAKSEGSVNSEKALAITQDNEDNVYIAGYFSDNTIINGTPINGYGGRDIYIAKYDKNGVFQWIKTAGSTGRDEAKFIKCDNNGGVYICGMFSNNTTFGTQTFTTDGYQDSYIAKYATSDGSLQWVKAGGAQLDDVAWSMTMDNAGSIYISGEFNSYIHFGMPQGIPTTGNTDIFVAKFDPSGNCQWIKGGGGPVTDRARGIGSDGNSIFVTGQFGLTANFGGYTVGGPSQDSSEIFIAALNSTGDFLWATFVDGPNDAYEPLGYESGNAICGRNGMVYSTGGLLPSSPGAVAGIFGATTLNGYDRTDMYVAAIGVTGGTVSLAENRFENDFNIFPNPSGQHFTLNLDTTKGDVSLKVYNTIGELVYLNSYPATTTISCELNNCESGIYLVEVSDASGKFARKKLIIEH